MFIQLNLLSNHLLFQPKSARQYTIEEYEDLKEELRQKQRAYKSMFVRPQTAFI